MLSSMSAPGYDTSDLTKDDLTDEGIYLWNPPFLLLAVF